MDRETCEIHESQHRRMAGVWHLRFSADPNLKQDENQPWVNAWLNEGGQPEIGRGVNYALTAFTIWQRHNTTDGASRTPDFLRAA